METKDQTIERLKAEIAADQKSGNNERLGYVEHIAKLQAECERLTELQRVTELGVVAAESAHQDAEDECEKLQAVVDVAKECCDDDDSYYNVTADLKKAIAALDKESCDHEYVRSCLSTMATEYTCEECGQTKWVARDKEST